MSIASCAGERIEARRLGFSLNRVTIRDYKNIRNCDVRLGPFTLLVGRNGAGKSNFLDALRLVSEGLRDPQLQESWSLMPWSGVADEGFLEGEPRISLEMSLGPTEEATYSVRLVGVHHRGGFVVRNEQLTVREGREVKAHYRCSEGEVLESSIGLMPPASMGRLYLTRASAVPEFRAVYDALSSTGFYDLNPESICRDQEASRHSVLARDGSNLASIFDSLASAQPKIKERVISYLTTIVPEFANVHYWASGPYSTMIFERAEAALDGRKSFYARVVSDGTLRVLGLLIAVNQLASDGRPIRLVGIEEPETALHPAAAGVLMDALREAATHTQVLVTTHSADLLDRYDPDEDHLLAVESRDGRTEIGPIDRASREVIRKRLYSAGELLRMDQIEVDRREITPPEADSPDPRAGELR